MFIKKRDKKVDCFSMIYFGIVRNIDRVANPEVRKLE